MAAANVLRLAIKEIMYNAWDELLNEVEQDTRARLYRLVGETPEQISTDNRVLVCSNVGPNYK